MPKFFSPRGRSLLGALLCFCALLTILGAALPYFRTLPIPPQNWGQTAGAVLHTVSGLILFTLGAYFVHSRVYMEDFFQVGKQEEEREKRYIARMQHVEHKTLSFHDFSLRKKFFYAASVLLGFAFVFFGTIDLLGFMTELQIPAVDGTIITVSHWLSGFFFLIFGLVTIFILQLMKFETVDHWTDIKKVIPLFGRKDRKKPDLLN